jgi:voltage-gated potassium channel
MRLPPGPPRTTFEAPATAAGWRGRLHQIIFEADTPAGRTFDLTLIGLILVSVVLVSLETVGGMRPATYRLLRVAEWAITIAFTIEYVLRLLAVRRPLRYARSFFGLVDLLSILPTYLSLVAPGGQYLAVIRVLRLLRIFRVLKLTRFLTEAHGLGNALRASAHKISIFLLTVVTIVIIVGSLMYLVEGGANGFTSIPRSMYWAVVTLTTVGYGDIRPGTDFGQAVASLVMILGYGIIAVPTGIVTVELAQVGRAPLPISTQACPTCSLQGHDADAKFCKHCGSGL